MNQLQPYRPAQGPPVEQGETLAAFDRNRGTERLRVSLETFNGYDFVRLQAWQVNSQGEWWPCKGRCITIKLGEIGGMVDALRMAESLVGLASGDGQSCKVSRETLQPAHGRRDHQPASRGSSTWPRPHQQGQGPLPGPRPGSRAPDGVPFDEIGDE